MRLPEAVARRVTRSSFGSVPDSSSKKKMQKPVQNNRDTRKRNTEKSSATPKKVTTLRRSLEKPVTVTKELKRMTRSSFGSVTGSCSLRNRNPTSTPVTKTVLNVQKLIKSKPNSQKNKQVTSKDSKRMTRSSLGIETGSTTSQIRSAEKHIKSKQIVEKKDPSVITKVSKKVTRSSLGSVTSSTSMKNKNSQNKISVSPQVQSSDQQSKLKKTIEEKELISGEDPKRTTRSSLASATTTSISLRNKSPVVKNAAPPLQKQEHVEKRAKTKNTTKDKNPQNVGKPTKRLTRSSLGDAFSTSSVVEETHECMIVESPLLLSVSKTKQKNLSDGSDKLVKKTKKTDKKDSKQKNLSDGSDEVVTKTDKKEVVKKTKESDKSTNTRKKKLSAAIESTPGPSTSSTRKKSSLQSGSLSEELNPGESKTSKRGKGKTKVSPSVEGKRKREISPAILAAIEDLTSSPNFLTDKVSNKKPRRHTEPHGTKRAKTVSTTQRKSMKKSSIKSTPKSSAASRNDSTFTPDISLLPVDSISTFMSQRPKSAPAAIVKPPPAKGSKSSIPKKGTLKRKRWLLNTLKEKNEGYEDDIFENMQLGTPMRFPIEDDNESDTSIATPKFGFILTPAAIPKKMPKFKDCISSTDLLLARKCAEEYQFRRQNRKNQGNNIIPLKTPASTSFGQVPEKKKLEFTEAMDKIKAIQNNMQKRAEEESEEEDDYFNDLMCS